MGEGPGYNTSPIGKLFILSIDDEDVAERAPLPPVDS